MSYIFMPPEVVDEQLDLLVSRLNQGSSLPRPELRIYSTGGPQHGTLLAVLQFYLPAFTPSCNGQVVANPITPCQSCLAGGKAEYFTAVAMDGSVRFMGSVGKMPDPDPKTGVRPPSPYVISLMGTDIITPGAVLSIDAWKLTWGQLQGAGCH